MTWGSTAAALGVEAAGMLVTDENAQEVLGFAALGISLIAVPRARVPKVKAPDLPVFKIPRPKLTKSGGWHANTHIKDIGVRKTAELSVDSTLPSSLPSSPPSAVRSMRSSPLATRSSASSASDAPGGPATAGSPAPLIRSRTSALEQGDTLPSSFADRVNSDNARLTDNVVLHDRDAYQFRKIRHPNKVGE